MYELINCEDYGLEVDRPLMIVKREPAFAGRRRTVFTLTLHDRKQALEILDELNNPEARDAA